MTPDSLDSEPVVSTFACKRCSECEGWKVDVEDGICRACRILPIAPMPSQESPKWVVYDGDSYHTFSNADEAIRAAGYFGTTARRVR